MTSRIERIERNGEPRRRFFLIAEVTFSDSGEDGGENYYADDEMRDVMESWVDGALDDPDDGPDIRFLDVPQILDADIQAIARGEYPSDEECRQRGLI